MSTVLPYGSWPSPITLDDVLGGSVGLQELTGDGDSVLWLESLPDEDGRQSLVRHRHGTTVEITPRPISVRSRVMEYGGGAYHARAGWVVYCDDHDGGVHVLEPDQERRPITPVTSPFRYGGLRVHPRLRIATAIREDHSGPGEAVTAIVALDLDTDNRDGGRVLVSGADFYACADISPDGRLAWMEWDHPNMPWDQTRVRVGRVQAASVTSIETVSDLPDAAATRPQWLPDGRLLFFTDASGFWTPHVWDGREVRSVTGDEHDYAAPLWTLNHDAAAGLPDGSLVVAPFVAGRREIVLLTPDGERRRLGEPWAGLSSLAVADGQIWAIAGNATAPAAVVRIDPRTGRESTVRRAGDAPEAPVSVARPLTVAGRHGTVHGWYYPPTPAGDIAAPPDERPPLIVLTHGGPTSMTTPEFDLSTQFWTSRGFGVVDVNYSGSTGFGRAYRNRLRGQWGVADVDDCVDAVSHLDMDAAVDASRVIITGGSAGGYTTLQALVSSDVFAAGVSRYGVGDLELLVRDTHKFESRYLDSLVGPYPAQRDLYLARSPIHHLGALRTPMLLLQGLDDRVVPPNQAETMARAVRDRGLPVALVMFEGEGHGFRSVAARRRRLECEVSFFAQLFGYTPADDVPRLAIDNLRSRDLR